MDSIKKSRGITIWLWLLVFFDMLIRAISTESNRIFYDGCGYIMHAWSIAQGRLTTPYWMAGIDHYYPPLYPFFIYLFHFVIRNWVYAAKTVSIISSGLLLLPVFALGKKLFYEEIGLLACAFLVAHPLLVEVGANAYSEPIFLFFIALSMLWGYRLLVEKKSWLALLSGTALGIANLGRAQALAGLLSLAAILFIWWMRRQLSLGQFARFAVLVLAGFYLFALPYDYYNHKKDGIWGMRLRMEFFKKGYRFEEDLEWFQRERMLNKNATSLLTVELAKTNSPLAFIREHPKTYLDWVRIDALTMLDREFGQHKIVSPVFIFSFFILMLGLIFIREPRLKNPSAHLYLLFWFLPVLVIVPLSVCVLDRYFLPLLFSLAFWAAGGVEIIRERAGRFFSLGIGRSRTQASRIGFWLMALVILQIFSGRFRELYLQKTSYPKKEANWVAEITGNSKRKIIMSNDPYPALYSGNYWYMLPLDNINRISIYARSQAADYVAVDMHFFEWLHAPQELFDQFSSPFSKPGLVWLGENEAKFRAGFEHKLRELVLYKVESEELPKAPVNIILVSIDTLRADHLSCYGYQRKTSPNIDRIAAAGLRFEHVFSQSPKTAPSHMTMLTSLYPEVHWVHGEYKEHCFDKLNPAWKTLAEILKENGYRTAAFTGGVQMTKGFGFERGFESFQENMLRLDAKSFDPALNWLSKLKPEEHFFLFLHTYQVHDPYCPPRPFNKLYDPDYHGWIIDDWDEVTRLADSHQLFSRHNVFWGGAKNGVNGDQVNLALVSDRDAKHMEALYDGNINYADEMLGRFFAELKKRGLLGNEKTLLIITSDHGEEFREHGDFLHKKLFRETMEVPLVFYWPGRLPSGKVIAGQARLIDLAPTLLDLAGIPAQPQMQGVSLKAPMLEGQAVSLSAYSEDPFLRRDYALRSGLWMYYQMINDGKEELYLNAIDINEKQNILNLVKDIENFRNGVFYKPKRILAEYQKKMEYFHSYNARYKEIFEIKEGPRENLILSKKQLEDLRTLGYLK